MALEDLITIGQLLIGVVWGTGILILWRRYKSRPDTWPRIFGIGGAIYMFVLSIVTSVLLRPSSELVNYIAESIFWSFAVGIVAYFSGRVLATRFRNIK
jgi:hypothetical protein